MQQRRLVLQLGLAGALALARPVRACEFFASTLRVTHPWTRATADDATTAIVCMRFDEVQVDDRLIGLETPIATGAELGGHGVGTKLNLAIPQGRETQLTEHGTHIRLTGLLMPLDVGRSYPMRLLFLNAGVLRADLSVDYARFK